MLFPPTPMFMCSANYGGTRIAVIDHFSAHAHVYTLSLDCEDDTSAASVSVWTEVEVLASQQPICTAASLALVFPS